MAPLVAESVELSSEDVQVEAGLSPEQAQHVVVELEPNEFTGVTEDSEKQQKEVVEGKEEISTKKVVEGQHNEELLNEAKTLSKPEPAKPKFHSKVFKGLIAVISIVGSAALPAIMATSSRLEKVTRGYLFSFYCIWGFLCLILSLSLASMITLNRGGRKSLMCCTGLAVFALTFTGWIALVSLRVAYSTWITFTILFAGFFFFLIMLPFRKPNSRTAENIV